MCSEIKPSEFMYKLYVVGGKKSVKSSSTSLARLTGNVGLLSSELGRAIDEEEAV